jgi:hypothetical protein
LRCVQGGDAGTAVVPAPGAHTSCPNQAKEAEMFGLFLNPPLPASSSRSARTRAFLGDLGAAFVAARAHRARFGAF